MLSIGPGGIRIMLGKECRGGQLRTQSMLGLKPHRKSPSSVIRPKGKCSFINHDINGII